MEVLRLVFAVFFVVIVSAGKNVKVVDRWPGGFKAEVTIHVTKAQSDWRLTLKFGLTIKKFQIWSAIVESKNDREVVLKPMDFNRNVKPGDMITFIIVVDADGNPDVSASLSGESGGGKPVNPGGGKPGGGKPLPGGITNGPAVVSKGKYDYCDLLQKSIYFYEAQRSGKLPGNNQVKWRGNSGMGDRGRNGEDLTGGWYDAGDHVKFGLPMSWSTTVLLWGLIDYEDSYKKCGQYRTMLDSVKWTLDWFLKAHTKTEELYAQVGNVDADHAYWGPPERMSMARPSFKLGPGNAGSDIAGQYAAALAAGSIAFKRVDADYSAKLLRHAKQIFNFGDKYRGKYTAEGGIPAAPFYTSGSYKDDLAFGAAWLLKATGDNSYKSKAISLAGGQAGWAFSWDEQWAGTNVLLYQITKDGTRRELVESYLKSWMPGGGITYTPKGLAWRLQWGSLRYSANTAFLALKAADLGINAGQYLPWAEKQIGYMLGDTGRSFVCGYGKNPPVRPHHRAASCSNGGCASGWSANPHVLYGALVGGPDQNDNYNDSRDDYIQNEVADDYNAGFQSALAALQHRSG